MEHLLMADDYVKILQERFKNPDIEYRNAEWAPLSENVEGFMGDHYILKITYILDNTKGTENFFVKTKPSRTELQKQMASTFNAYEKETFLYDKLYREYEKMGYYTGFAPKVYYCKNVETLIMEDLHTKGFMLRGRRNFYDLDHCKASLKALAYFHANSISYEEAKSEELGRIYRIAEENPNIFTEILYIVNNKEGFGAKYIQTAIDSFKKIVKVLPESEEWQNDFLDKLESFDGAEIFTKELPYRKACTHGDLWCNNMLFKYSEGLPTRCCLFDYQVLRQHHPSFDVLLLIYSNTLRAFRKQHLQDLIHYYYATFGEILKENGYSANEILPWDQFLESLDYFKSIAVLQALAGRTLTLMPTDITNSAMNDSDDLKDLMLEDRPTSIMRAFDKDEVYRTVLSDDMYELYECL